MNDSDQASHFKLEASHRIAMIIHGALIVGALGMAGITLAITLPNGVNLQLPFLTMMTLSFAPIALVVSLIAPSFVLKSARANHNQDRLGTVQSAFLIRAALIEGPTFMFLVTFIVEKSLIGWFAAIFLIGCLIILFPFRSRFESWYEAIED